MHKQNKREQQISQMKQNKMGQSINQMKQMTKMELNDNQLLNLLIKNL